MSLYTGEVNQVWEDFEKKEENVFPLVGDTLLEFLTKKNDLEKEVIIFSCCSVIFNKCAVKAFVSKIQKNYRNSHDHDKEGTTRGPKREFSLIHKVIEDSVNNGSIWAPKTYSSFIARILAYMGNNLNETTIMAKKEDRIEKDREKNYFGKKERKKEKEKQMASKDINKQWMMKIAKHC